MKAIIPLFLIGLFLVSRSNAQANSKSLLQVDEPIGDFILNDISNYSKKAVTNEDFKGKWLILDFWNQSCVVCVHAMPKMDSLQQKQQGKAQVILVGYTGSQYHQLDRHPDEKSIKTLYNRVKKNSNLNLAAAFDSTLFHRFDITSCPYIVVINPDGIVKAITTHIISSQVDSLRNNMKVSLSKAYTQSEIQWMRLYQKQKN